MKRFVEFISYSVLGILLALAAPAAAATIYSAGSLLQTGDVHSSHILDGTILNVDINNNAKILTSKIAGGNGDGTIPFSDFGGLATSSYFKYATSTKTLSVIAGKIAATSTSLNGVDQTWPSSNGSSGTFLTNDGNGSLSWTSPNASLLSKVYTAGETLTPGEAVAIGSDNVASSSSPGGGGPFGYSISGNFLAASSSSITAGSLYSALEIQVYDGTASCNATIEYYIETSSNNVPSGVVLANGTSTSIGLGTGGPTDLYIPLSSPVLATTSASYVIFHQYGGTCTNVNITRNVSTSIRSDTSTTLNGTYTYSNTLVNGIAFQFETSSSQYVYGATAKSVNRWYTGFVGIAEAAASGGNSVTVDMLGFSSAIKNLTAATTYYLADATGTLSTSAGTNSLKIGTSAGTSGFILRPDNP